MQRRNNSQTHIGTDAQKERLSLFCVPPVQLAIPPGLQVNYNWTRTTLQSTTICSGTVPALTRNLKSGLGRFSCFGRFLILAAEKTFPQVVHNDWYLGPSLLFFSMFGADFLVGSFIMNGPILYIVRATNKKEPGKNIRSLLGRH